MGRPILDLTGQTFGRLTVIDRAGSNRRGYACWHCTCTCGGTSVAIGADLRSGNTKSCGCGRRKGLPAMWVANTKPDAQIGYTAAHARVKRARGSASEYICVGCCGQAAHWSLRHDAPVTHNAPASNGTPCRYSGNPDDYDPRCVSCHRTYDLQGDSACRT